MKIKDNVSFIDSFRKSQALQAKPKEITVMNRCEEVTLEITALSSMEIMGLGLERRAKDSKKYSEFVMEMLSKHVVWIADLTDLDFAELGVSDAVEIADTYFDTVAATKAFLEILSYSPTAKDEDVDEILEVAESLKN